MPSGCLLSPETGVPNRDLFLDRSDHDQDQTNRCELRQHAKGDSQAAGDLRDTEKHGERRGHTDALCPLLGISDVGPAAGHEYRRCHQSQQQQTEVGELRELWKHHVSSLR